MKKSGQTINVYTYVWNKVDTPKGVVQIFHGMAEHAKRYTDFAAFLNYNGFIVYANDHRGHGKTASDIMSLGYIGQDGFNAIVEDEYKITRLIKAQHKNLPLIILGHSFGSFIAWEYLTRYSHAINGMILSGSALQKGFKIQIGTLITTLQHRFIQDTKPNQFIEYLTFGSFNKKFLDTDAKFRWISSDPHQVEKYEKDPYCGLVFPINFYYYLFRGLKDLYRKEKLAKIRKDIPLLIISGSLDPVGNYSKSVTKLYKFLLTLNFQDVSLKLFEEDRHELLHEKNKEEVYNYLFNWLKQIP
ncbi:alpha/beta hydrolase [Cellulosilyticum sp. I15G10I2]|uniref:alpha/beta hydrolase n=1 Tax=Cellulosilyticum sp. I15G10I2 TaxID=1892843 RepID=UPI00085BDA43|nr:alpha/beta hydrolase [Cellulosilyticum sp. I15G10I2]